MLLDRSDDVNMTNEDIKNSEELDIKVWSNRSSTIMFIIIVDKKCYVIIV